MLLRCSAAIKLAVVIFTVFFSTTSKSAESGLALEEVIVTAQKKAESLQDTPISITAFGEDALEKQGISSLGDIGSKVPALTIEPFPINNATLRIFIRGIGITDAQVTQDPPVGIYVDGAYIARSTGTALDVAELERMEILRGPQGTLYGRNTTGGAINLITKKPNTEAFEFKQKFTAGNFGAVTSKTTVNIPIADTMAAKLSYLKTRSDGFVDNGGPGGDWGDRKARGLRLDLRWDAADWLEVDYAYDRSNMQLYNQTYQAETPATPRGSVVDLVAGQANQKVVDGPGYTDKRLDRLNSFSPLEASKTEISGHALTLTFSLSETAQFKYIGAYRELSDAAYADLASGAADEEYRLDSHAYTAPDGSVYPYVVPVVEQDQFSHEFQLSGDAFEGSLTYILGAYYFEESATEDNSPVHHQFSGPVDGAAVSGQLVGGLTSVLDAGGTGNGGACDGVPAGGLLGLLGTIGDAVCSVTDTVLQNVVGAVGGGLVDGLDLSIANLVSQKYEIANEAWAVFGQATWTPDWLEQRLHFTLGARHSEDKRSASKDIDDRAFFYFGGQSIEATTAPANCAPTDLSCSAVSLIVSGLGIPDPHKVYASTVSKRFKDDSFNAVAEFDATDDINIYFKVVQAYKSGGFNTRDPHQNASSAGNDFGFGFEEGFDEEKVLSYELGLKSELFDRRLRLNANVFFSEYTDIQLNFLVQGTVSDTKVANAGQAEMKGFEADLTFLASRSILLSLNYAYLNAKVTKARDPISGADITEQYTFGSAPRHSYTAMGNWIISDSDFASTSLNVSYNYMGNRNGGVRRDGKPNLLLRDYYLWNARLSIDNISLGGGVMNIGFWGKNLLDREYEITTVDNLPHANRASIWGTPRSYGLDVSYQF